MRKLSETLGYPLNSIWRAMTLLKEERYVSTTPTGRYLVHPRFQLTKKGDKTLSIAFIAHGELSIDNSFIQRVYSALDQNQDGFNIRLNLHLITDLTTCNPADVADYDAVILGTMWMHDFYDSIKKTINWSQP